MAFQNALAGYGVMELVRTGKISLKRGDETMKVGNWSDSLFSKRFKEESENINYMPNEDINENETNKTKNKK